MIKSKGITIALHQNLTDQWFRQTVKVPARFRYVLALSLGSACEGDIACRYEAGRNWHRADVAQ